MYLDVVEERMLSGKEGAGRKKAMEILCAIGDGVGAERMVKITYAHLMPPDVMFFPYGRQGQWAHDMTWELLQDVDHFKVPTTIEPMFVDLNIASQMEFPDSIIEEMRQIMGAATARYEKLGVIPNYSALPFYVYPTRFGQHISIAESNAILWANTVYGSRCERDDGITSLASAITGCTPEAGVHLDSNRFAEVVVRFKNDLDVNEFTDADYDALSFAASRKTMEKKPVFEGIPTSIGYNYLKHFIAPIAVESGLAIMHIVGVTPEAPTLEAALGGKKPVDEIFIGKREIEAAYEITCTATDSHIDYIMMGCPHLTMIELRELAEVLQGKKIKEGVKFIAVTTHSLLKVAEDMGYARAIKDAGVMLTSDMCIAFSGTQATGVIATNSIKAAFFYSGFSSKAKRSVWFGSTKDCAKAALSGKWERRK